MLGLRLSNALVTIQWFVLADGRRTFLERHQLLGHRPGPNGQ